MNAARDSFLPYALPSIGEEEIAEVVDTLHSGWISTGPKVKRFESDFAHYIDARHAIAVSSCTTGLHIALTALGIGPGDEVIVPTLTFCSTANVVVHVGARPVLVDVDEDFNVTPQAIESAITPRTKALLPVHYSGQACDLEAIYHIAAKHNVAVIEDAAHAVGSTYHGHKIGSSAFSQLERAGSKVKAITVFSFYATKNMTTGEGGMLATADDTLAERLRLLTLHGMSRDAWKRYASAESWHYDVGMAGYKGNMTDIQAALGIHQLRRLDGFIEVRQRYAQMYARAFTGMPELETPITYSDRSHTYHLYVIRLNLERLTINRAQFIEELGARNIGTSVHFIPVHLHSFYQKQEYYPLLGLFRSEELYNRIISLPLYPRMTPDDMHDVIAAVADVVRVFKRGAASSDRSAAFLDSGN